MSPKPVPQTQNAQPPQLATETRPMTFTLNRFLDVAASILIVFLASRTAGATAFLGV